MIMRSCPAWPCWRERLLSAAGCLLPLLLSLLHPAVVEAYPTRPLLIVVPFAAGGSNDILGRLIGERLQRAWGQSAIVENQAGAAGSIGAARVAKAAADGHTMLVISTGFSINAVLQVRQPFDAATGFAPVALLGRSPMVLAVSPRHPIKTPAELVTLARAQPGKLTYGSAGSGSINHIGGELLRSGAGIEISHVPYRGVTPALTDVIGGHVDMIVASLTVALEQVRSGKVTGLAVTSLARVPMLPELPTLDETVAPGYELVQWWGIMVPAGTPAEVVAKLNGGINDALDSEEVRQALAREGAQPTPGPPAALAGLIRSDIARWQRLVKDGALQPAEAK